MDVSNGPVKINSDEASPMDLFMQDTPKVTSEVTPQSMYVEYYTHSFLTFNRLWGLF